MAQETAIDFDTVNDITVISFNHPNIGAIDGIEKISGEVNAFVDENQPLKLVFDFAGVKFFNSQALGMLIEIWRKLEKYEGRMVISGINPQLYRVFKITNLNNIFKFYEDVQLAVQSFGD